MSTHLFTISDLLLNVVLIVILHLHLGLHALPCLAGTNPDVDRGRIQVTWSSVEPDPVISHHILMPISFRPSFLASCGMPALYHAYCSKSRR